MRDEGHHSGGGIRHAALPGDHGRFQAAASGVRQADDLLPAGDAHVRRDPGHSLDHHDEVCPGPAEFIETNIAGTFTLLQEALRHWRGLDRAAQQRFRFHHISTDEVYGSLGPEGLFTETTPYAPNSPYAASKASSDHLVRAWRETYGLPTLLTNCSNNYGPYHFPEKLIPHMIIRGLAGQSLVGPLNVYGRSKEAGERRARSACPRHLILRTSWVFSPYGTNFVRTMLRLGAERSELGVVDDQTGCPTAAADLAGAILAVLAKAAEPGFAAWGTYHYRGADILTWHGFAKLIFEQAARYGQPVPRLVPIETAAFPSRATRPAYSVLSTEKIARTLGIRPRPLRDSLRECLAELLIQLSPR